MLRYLPVAASMAVVLSLAYVAPAAPLDPNVNPEVHTYDSMVDNPLGPFETGVPGSFQLPQFDNTILVGVPGLGKVPRELVSVTVIVTGQVIDGFNAMENEDPIQSNAHAEVGARIRVESDTPEAALVVLTFPRDSNDALLDPDNDAAPDFVGTDALVALADGDQDANNATIDVANDPVRQAPWVGTGNVTWNFDANSHLFAEISPAVTPVSALQSPKYHFTAEVQYLWQVGVPEPTTAALLAVPAAAVLLAPRRRRRR